MRRRIFDAALAAARLVGRVADRVCVRLGDDACAQGARYTTSRGDVLEHFAGIPYARLAESFCMPTPVTYAGAVHAECACPCACERHEAGPQTDATCVNPDGGLRIAMPTCAGHTDADAGLRSAAGAQYVPGDALCSQLDIYRAPGGGAPRRVVVYVHGGMLTGGSRAHAVHRADEMLRSLPGDGGFGRETVVVAVEYSLGAYGWWYAESPGSGGGRLDRSEGGDEAGGGGAAALEGVFGTHPANLALHQVIQALLWVQRHISAFNGDPHDVTLMGHSAGASLAHWVHLVLTPDVMATYGFSAAPVHKLLLMSGTAFLFDACSPADALRTQAEVLAALANLSPKPTDPSPEHIHQLKPDLASAETTVVSTEKQIKFTDTESEPIDCQPESVENPPQCIEHRLASLVNNLVFIEDRMGSLENNLDAIEKKLLSTEIISDSTEKELDSAEIESEIANSASTETEIGPQCGHYDSLGAHGLNCRESRAEESEHTDDCGPLSTGERGRCSSRSVLASAHARDVAAACTKAKALWSPVIDGVLVRANARDTLATRAWDTKVSVALTVAAGDASVFALMHARAARSDHAALCAAFGLPDDVRVRVAAVDPVLLGEDPVAHTAARATEALFGMPALDAAALYASANVPVQAVVLDAHLDADMHALLAAKADALCRAHMLLPLAASRHVLYAACYLRSAFSASPSTTFGNIGAGPSFAASTLSDSQTANVASSSSPNTAANTLSDSQIATVVSSSGPNTAANTLSDSQTANVARSSNGANTAANTLSDSQKANVARSSRDGANTAASAVQQLSLELKAALLSPETIARAGRLAESQLSRLRVFHMADLCVLLNSRVAHSGVALSFEELVTPATLARIVAPVRSFIATGVALMPDGTVPPPPVVLDVEAIRAVDARVVVRGGMHSEPSEAIDVEAILSSLLCPD